MKKLVDTTTTQARAEKELEFSPRFLRFVRGRFEIGQIKSVSAIEVTKKYNLKGIVFGNYMTQEERHFYLFKTEKQMECLAKIRGNKNLGKGVLILSIGAAGVGGKANAHYAPTDNLINLSRGRKGDYKNFMKGENSFVHEYAHFIDFEQGRKHDPKLNHNFASENTNPNWENKTTLLFCEPVLKVKQDKEYMKGLKTPYLKSDIEIFARLFEAGITHYVQANEKQYAKYFDKDYYSSIYYPKNKILDEKIDKSMVQILRASK